MVDIPDKKQLEQALFGKTMGQMRRDLGIPLKKIKKA